MDKKFSEENHAYENAFGGMRENYLYYALNEYYGKFNKKYEPKIDVLGYGAAEGYELRGIAASCNRICIVDPTNIMKSKELGGVPLEYFSPKETGLLEFENETFDLITCFGVLMYIMNPEVVLNEFIRVLKPGGTLLIREPSTDMHVGQGIERWGMGEESRGLPPDFYEGEFVKLNVSYNITHCMFSPWIEFGKKVMKAPMNHRWFIKVDSLFCKLFKWNWKYQRQIFCDKFAPGSLFVTVKKF